METRPQHEVCLAKSLSFELVMELSEDIIRGSLLDQEPSRDDVASASDRDRDQQHLSLGKAPSGIPPAAAPAAQSADQCHDGCSGHGAACGSSVAQPQRTGRSNVDAPGTDTAAANLIPASSSTSDSTTGIRSGGDAAGPSTTAAAAANSTATLSAGAAEPQTAAAAASTPVPGAVAPISTASSSRLQQRGACRAPQIEIPDHVSDPGDGVEEGPSASGDGLLGSPRPSGQALTSATAVLPGSWGYWQAPPGVPLSPQALQLDHVDLEVIDDLAPDPTRLRGGVPPRTSDDLRRTALYNRSGRNSIAGSPAAAPLPHAAVGFPPQGAPLFLSDAERMPPLLPASPPVRPSIGVASILLQASPQPLPVPTGVSAAGPPGVGAALPDSPSSPQVNGPLPPPMFCARPLHSMPASPILGGGAGTPVGSSTGVSSTTPRYGLHGASPLSPSRPLHPPTPTSHLRARSQSGMRDSWSDGRRLPSEWINQNLLQMMPPQLRAVADLGAAAAASDSWRGSSRRTSISSISASQLGEGTGESEGTPTAAAGLAGSGDGYNGLGGFAAHWQQLQQQRQQMGEPGSFVGWLPTGDAAMPPSADRSQGDGSGQSSPVARGSGLRLPPGLHFYSATGAGTPMGPGPLHQQLSVSATCTRLPEWDAINGLHTAPGLQGPHHQAHHAAGAAGEAGQQQQVGSSPRPSRLNPGSHLLHPGPVFSPGLGSSGSLVSPIFPGPVLSSAPQLLPLPAFRPREPAQLETEGSHEGSLPSSDLDASLRSVRDQQLAQQQQCGTPTGAAAMARASPLSPTWRGAAAPSSATRSSANGSGVGGSSSALHVLPGAGAVFPSRVGVASPSVPLSRFGAAAVAGGAVLVTGAEAPASGHLQHLPHQHTSHPNPIAGPHWAALQRDAAGGELHQVLGRTSASSRPRVLAVASYPAPTGLAASAPLAVPAASVAPAPGAGAPGVPPQRLAASLLGRTQPSQGVSKLMQDTEMVGDLLGCLQGVDQGHPLVVAMVEALRVAQPATDGDAKNSSTARAGPGPTLPVE